MSVQTPQKRITVPEIRAHKGGKPVVMLTCYHAHTAKLLDSHVDMMLVGDTLGMVIHGMKLMVGSRGKHWLAMPAEKASDKDGKPILNGKGKQLWNAFVKFANPAAREKFQNCVLDMLRRQQAFDDSGAP